MLDRFRPEDEDNMHPFFLMKFSLRRYGAERRLLAYTRKPALKALAEIQVIENGDNHGRSVPGCVHIDQCIRGTPGGLEPIQKRMWQNGEPIYVFNPDAMLVGTPSSIPCIAVKAMRSWMMNSDVTMDGGFVDPLGRVARNEDGSIRVRMTIEVDYYIFFVFDDAAMKTGICSHLEDAAPTQQPSVSYESLSLPSDPLVASGLPAKKKNKKKKKK